LIFFLAYFLSLFVLSGCLYHFDAIQFHLHCEFFFSRLTSFVGPSKYVGSNKALICMVTGTSFVLAFPARFSNPTSVSL